MRAARFVALQRALHDYPRELQHVIELAGEGETGVGPLALVAEVDVVVTLQQFDDLLVGQLQPLVVADHGGVLGHDLAQFAPQLKGILRTLAAHQALVDFGLARDFGRVAAIAFCGRNVLRILERNGAGGESAEDATDQRIRAQAVGAVVLVLALAGGEQAADVGHLAVVYPQAAHGVVHAGEDLHGHFARIVADEFFVDFEDAFELAVERLAIDVGEVQVDHRLSVDAEVVLVYNFVNGARGHVAGYEVAVFRIPLFKEVPALRFRDLLEGAIVAGFARHPHAAAFAARRLGHEAQLVFARNGSGMHLDEFAIGVIRALLEHGRLRGTGADHGIGALAEDGADAAGGKNHRIGREGAKLHGTQIERRDAAAIAFAIDD